MTILAGAKPLPITLSDVDVRAGPVPILRRVSLSFLTGAPTVIVGPNGSGKSTLLRVAMGLIAPNEGRISWATEATAPANGLAIVFQRPVMLRRGCAANIHYALATAGVSGTSRRSRTAELLRLVGLDTLASRPARRLSGGEQQRVALARALAQSPSVLLLDEPTSSLDPAATQEIEALIGKISSGGVKIIMATHDLGEARRLAGEVVFLNRGTVVENGLASDFFRSPRTEEGRRFLSGDLLL